jgi:hypothetical protein
LSVCCHCTLSCRTEPRTVRQIMGHRRTRLVLSLGRARLLRYLNPQIHKNIAYTVIRYLAFWIRRAGLGCQTLLVVCSSTVSVTTKRARLIIHSDVMYGHARVQYFRDTCRLACLFSTSQHLEFPRHACVAKSSDEGSSRTWGVLKTRDDDF